MSEEFNYWPYDWMDKIVKEWQEECFKMENELFLERVRIILEDYDRP